jgi:hypothetical protein
MPPGLISRRLRGPPGAKRETAEDVDRAVATIIADVVARGDEALIEYTRRFDRFDLTPDRLRVSDREIDAALAEADRQAFDALRLAATRIETYHAQQVPADHDETDSEGVRLGWRWTAIQAAGLYVPGGTASYPSSVLMNAIPAKVAGVERVVMVVPTPDGVLNPLVLAAARIAGVDEVYRVGGAHAVAALAYGTQTIAPVAKIVGPGNAYVAAAKRRVFGQVGIDMIAGPSEVLILADARPIRIGSRPTSLPRPSTTRPRKRSSSPTRPISPTGSSARWRRSSPPCRVPPLPARAGAISARSSSCRTCQARFRSSTASRRSTWKSRRRRPMIWPGWCAMPDRSSLVRIRRRRWGITWPGRTTSCRPPAPPASRPGSASRFHEAHLLPALRPALARPARARRIALGRAEGLEAHARSIAIRLEAAPA